MLSGLHLYVLESETSQNYQRSLRFSLVSFHHVALPSRCGLFFRNSFPSLEFILFGDSRHSLSNFFSGHCSMVGRQVFEVLPTNIGGSAFCIAISFRGMDSQKVSHVGLK